VTQATTAAVLRSTRVAHLAERDDRFAIDLSPRRVRLVEWLLDGVRNGQPLGALLGYRFERGLHEGHRPLQLDRYIQPLRDLAPLVAGKLEPVAGPTEAIAARNVVDGVALERKWRAGQIDLGALGLAAGPERNAVTAELDALSEAADAVGDAQLAESVHQVIRGNPVAAAATLDALGRGDAPPPTLDVVHTPRSGIPLAHRVMVVVQDGPPTAGWADTPRRRAEPLLDRWAGSLLAAVARARAHVVLVAEGRAAVRVDVGVREIGLAPIDLVTIAGDPGELERRVVDAARRKAGVLGRATVRFDRDGAAPGLADAVELARAIRAVMTAGRSLEPAHLALPDVPLAAATADPLADRARAAADELTAIAADLAAADPATRRRALRGAALFGVPGTWPDTADGSDPDDAMRARADQVAVDVAARLAAAATTGREHLAALFGSDLVVVEPFAPPEPAVLAATLAASDALQGGDPLAVTAWIDQVARVRGHVAPLADALMIADALGTTTAALRVGQLPFTAGDRWSALVPPAGASPEGKLSLVVHAPAAFDAGLPCAGLLLDEWTEVMPAATETTGLAFHFDQPGSRAAQAILLAVAPDDRAAWDTASLAHVLLETLDLARLRMVDNATLGQLGHYLPGLYLPYNTDGSAISVDVYRLMPRRGAPP
jgi:hypothetical protein